MHDMSKHKTRGGFQHRGANRRTVWTASLPWRFPCVEKCVAVDWVRKGVPVAHVAATHFLQAAEAVPLSAANGIKELQEYIRVLDPS